MNRTPIPLPRTTLDCRSRTLVMGVINTTPDSFSDGGVHFDPDIAIASAVNMIDQGADIIDVGGESTRPGSDFVDEEIEIQRTIPVISAISAQRPDSVISIDTRRRNVAEAAVSAGAQIINDVTGFRDDPGLMDFARECEAAVIVMHMLGTPKTMQKEITYHSFPGDIEDFFRERIRTLERAGIAENKIVIDPGIGFGKTYDQNLVLLNRIGVFESLGKPILVGASRKAFLGAILDEPVAAQRHNGTLAASIVAILRGAAMIRVHDLEPAVQAVRVVDAVLRERVKA